MRTDRSVDLYRELRRKPEELVIHAMADAGEASPPAAGTVMMGEKGYGRTRSGRPITDELLEELSEQAEVGFDVDEILRRRGGRPPMGSAAASVESVRLDPELSQALRQRAQQEGRTNSEVLRRALRRYLDVC